MNGFLVFLSKEWLEAVRTKKIYVLLGIFVFFAMISPLTARYVMELLRLLIPADELGTMLNIPDPVWSDSWRQFFGNNMSQMGIISMILMFMSTVSGEKKNGTAALTLTKNISHTAFITAKFTVTSVVYLICFIISLCINYFYTYLLFEQAGELVSILAGGTAFSIFILLVISMTVFTSTMSKGSAGSALLSFAGFILLGIISSLPRIGKYSPGMLLSYSTSLSIGVSSDWLIPSLIAAGLAVVFIAGSIGILKRQEL